MAPPPLLIDICICTFRRDVLADALASVAKLDVPHRARLRVIVADNDVKPSARARVHTMAESFPHELLYIHAPARNISIARNACLEAGRGDFLAFIDDDETVTRPWLRHLLDVALATGADAVLGPVRAVYGPDAPGWMRHADSHSTFPVWVKGEIRTGYTCNVLLKASSPLVEGRRFVLSFGRSGGEDTDFFMRLHEAGGKIAYAPKAWVEEVVPENRARFSWLAKRRFRTGQTHGRLLADRSAAGQRLAHVGLASLKAGYCFAVASALCPFPTLRNPSILRGTMHVGVTAGLLGLREIHQYGRVSPAAEHGNAA
ncbi:glycosyltransferase [Chelativorans salis]|uniref:Glycosyltransferase n=1 Tax=Chelativorans salis TaxID=2978478 RepID=A0ABT2LTH8_9HYPH|nr:glycosyltransferase family 2 protein [Chelativorans sp. EGI FJ00035]MCT7377835.1 glycosyltransferase [Chelativorans sp. EGI FJ00035]